MATCFPQNGHKWGRYWAGTLTPARWLSRRTVENEAFARCLPHPSRPRRLHTETGKHKHVPC